MKKCAVVSMMAVLVAALAALPVLAADEKPAGEAVTVTGTNYGVLAAYGAGADGGALGGLNALKVTESSDASLVGKTLHYVPTKIAQDLQDGEGHRSKTVKVSGKVFKDACALLVDSYEVVEGAAAAAGGDDFDDWDDLPVGTMSQQQIL